MSDYIEPDAVEMVVEMAKHAQQLYVRQGHDNFQPMFLFFFDSGPVIPVIAAGARPGDMHQAASAACDAAMKMAGEAPTNIVMHFDGLGIGGRDDLDPDAEPVTMEVVEALQGHLAEHFAAGDPRVYESLTTVLVRPTRTVLCEQRYRITSVDGWEWSAPEVKMDTSIDTEASLNWEWSDFMGGR